MAGSERLSRDVLLGSNTRLFAVVESGRIENRFFCPRENRTQAARCNMPTQSRPIKTQLARNSTLFRQRRRFKVNVFVTYKIRANDYNLRNKNCKLLQIFPNDKRNRIYNNLKTVIILFYTSIFIYSKNTLPIWQIKRKTRYGEQNLQFN